MSRKPKKVVRAFDLFCGIGGSSWGAELAGVSAVGALDKWGLATAAYKLNFPDATVFRSKARSISGARVRKQLGRIDLLIASPECTSHSNAKGKRRGSEDSRGTAFDVIRFARALRPRWVVVENVLQMRRWKRYGEWLEKLQQIGYKTEVGVLDAQHFSTPQSRRRLFIVGDLKLQPRLPKRSTRSLKSVKSVIGRGERTRHQWRFSPVNAPNRARATLDRAARARAAIGDRPAYIMVYYGTDGAGGFQTMDRPLRTITTLDRFALVRRNGRGDEMRMLQPSELAAAMGFSGRLRWPKTIRRERIKLLGNAVCPPVMRAVVRELLSAGVVRRVRRNVRSQ